MQEWATEIRDQCLGVMVPSFFKQWGSVQKKRAGRTWDEMPVSAGSVKSYFLNREISEGIKSFEAL